MRVAKLTLAVALLGAATLANASYWSRTNYGTYSAYDGTRVGGWNLSGNNWNHYVYYGQSQACQYGSITCTQTYAQAATFTWSLASSVSYQQTIIPEVNSLSVTLTYTAGRSFTDTNTYSVTIGPGKKSQYAEYVPRRYGNATVYGVRVATGATRTVCTAQGLIFCYKHATEWEYNDDPNRIGSVMYGWKNTSSQPIHTFVISSL
jgi:archaellin